MSDECTRTYAVNPDTAEDPCDDCGLDKRRHPAPMVEIHRCASCGELVEHDKRFEPESHGTTCRQPEIRMRRLESRVWEQEKRIADLLDKYKERNGQSTEDKQPSTQFRDPDGPSKRTIEAVREWLYDPSSRGDSPADASAAEPDSQAPAGAVPAGDSERDA